MYLRNKINLMIGKANNVNYFLANNNGDGNNAFNKIKPSSRK